MRYMMVVLLEFYPSWLALPREERGRHAAGLEAIIARYPQVEARFFDAEALPGKEYTDFLVCETEDLTAYHFMWEEIRDSEPYTRGYLKIKDVIMGMENAFRAFEASRPAED